MENEKIQTNEDQEDEINQAALRTRQERTEEESIIHFFSSWTRFQFEIWFMGFDSNCRWLRRQ